MTLLAPGFFYAGLVVAAAIAALHLLVTRQPRAAVLPTARFVPDLPASATARTTRPSDLILLLLRMLLVLAAAAALAEPVVIPSRESLARVILVDASRTTADISQARDSAKAVYRQGDAVIVFDSSGRAIQGGVKDSLDAIGTTTRKGSLSAALISAVRAASQLREHRDSLELVIVSPLGDEEWDAATGTIRKLWPGRARIMRVVGRTDSISRTDWEIVIRAPADDPVSAAASLVGRRAAQPVRIVRDGVGTEDTRWAADSGGVVVAWPVTVRPPGAVSYTQVDTAAALISDSSVVVAPFGRRWKFPSDSVAGAIVVARWIDGEPAAIERTDGLGCSRSVAIPVATAGDLAIRPEFVELVAALTAPCDAGRAFNPLPPVAMASLAGSGGNAPRNAFRAPSDTRSPVAPWLYLLALFTAIAELFVRHRAAGPKASSPRPAPIIASDIQS